MISLSVVTPAKKLVADLPVTEVFVPAHRGELNILEGHAPLMSVLRTGVLKYKAFHQKDFQLVAVSWGFLEVSKNRITVLAETAETQKELDLERVKLALEKAQKALAKLDMEQKDFIKYQLKLERAIVRMRVAQGTAE